SKGYAGRLSLFQHVLSGRLGIEVFGDYQFLDKDLKHIERVSSTEFDRDRNINTVMHSNQSLLITGVKSKIKDQGWVNYQFEKLNFSDAFNANRNVLNANLKLNNISLLSNNSLLKSDGNYSETEFARSE